MSTTTVTEYLAGLDEPLREIAAKLRPVIEAALPGATGVVWHGHPVWGRGDRPGRDPVCLVKAYPSYLTFGLWHGQQVDDPSGRLLPGARSMASVKLRSADEVDQALFGDWLRQAYAREVAA